jgi:serine/threonine-protein kinase
MADIFLARQHGHLGFRRLVIVKRIREEFLIDDRMIRLFLDEARLAARLDHPNIIRVHDLGLSDGSYYMVVDFIHGVSMAEILKRMVRRKMVMPVELALEIVRQLCLALEAAHVPGPDGKMLLHRDITPSNVLARMDGIVKLIDFGLAGWREFQRDRLRSGTVVGSIPYVPPEIILGHNLTPAVDLWGTGLLLLVLLTARHPFQRDSSAATMRAIVHEPLKIPSSVDKVAVPVIKAALERDPAKRVQTAADLRALINDALKQLAIGRLQTKGFLFRKTDLAPPPQMDEFLRDLFGDRVTREKNFIRKLGCSTLTDALLDGEAKYVEQFFASEDPNDFAQSTQRTEAYNTK